jgi:hypothetical protein
MAAYSVPELEEKERALHEDLLMEWWLCVQHFVEFLRVLMLVGR